MTAWPNRAERRREFSKRAQRIEAPPDVENKIRAELATSIANRRLEFRPGDTVDAVFRREIPNVFAFAREEGYALSFALPEMTPQALARGVIAYSLMRIH